jgi:CubicO group peptidase (beta-lactamase class C family)
MAGALMVAGVASAQEQTLANIAPGEGDPQILGILQQARELNGLPAISGALITSDGKVTMAVAGVRKAGTDVRATLQDKWHLGSNTKAMTATLIGRLVDRGELRWDSTLGELFPDIAEMKEEYKSVTVLQILTHHGGFAPNMPWGTIPQDLPIREQRAMAVEMAVTTAPAYPVGEGKLYSNIGYVVAGTIVEKITDKSWEEAMQEEIFEPLGMTSAGFGGLGTPGEIDQPWPHSDRDTPAATNGPAQDNLPVMGPAGRVHCSLQDYALFLADHMRRGVGEKPLLQIKTYDVLHTPPFEDEFAPGWIALDRTWAQGVALHHAGSNTMNYVVVWVAPVRGLAVVVATNQGNREMGRITDKVVGDILELQIKPAP